MFKSLLIISTLTFTVAFTIADEYLVQENGDKKEVKKQSDLTITYAEFSKRFKKHLNDYPQCSQFKAEQTKPFNNGAAYLQDFKISGNPLEIIATTAQTKKLTEVKIISQTTAKNDDALRSMICATYASIRAIQPSYGEKETILSQSNFLWKQAKQEPYEIGFELGKVKAQYMPFQISINPD